MKRARISAAFAFAFAASGCGFHPLYGNSSDTAENADKLASIYVDPIPERLGYELRNTLIDLFDSSGRASEDSYRLRVTLTQKSQGVAVQNDAAITRALSRNRSQLAPMPNSTTIATSAVTCRSELPPISRPNAA